MANSSYHFPNHKPVFLQILHHSLVSWKITPLYFFSPNITHFGEKKPIKKEIFETFKCSSQNSSNSRYQFLNDESIFLRKFASFSIVVTHNSSVNFKLIHFLLWIKESHQSPNFQTFECSSKTLSNSSCHFPRQKSAFFQVYIILQCHER